MKNLSILFISILFSCSSSEKLQNSTSKTPLYFPPLNSNIWENNTLVNLGWNESELQPLLNFLDEKNTKGFIILYKGKIVVENYFNNHTQNSLWYWASAGKTLTATMVGIAQDDGLININNKVSNYLQTGWTTTSLEKENLITCKNLLVMTSGLNNNLGDSIVPENLQFVANAGEKWAYHNVYLKMQDVVAQTSNQTWSNYFNLKLKNKIGMSGSWVSLENLNIYWSNTRSMARFGLLISNNGSWNTTQIVSRDYIIEATNTSQNINEAYGYLWWLNGKNTYQLPQSQLEFGGSLITNAPNDMFAALGKNDQKLYIVPSRDLVIVRLGDAANTSSNFAVSAFDNDLWEKINLLIN